MQNVLVALLMLEPLTNLVAGLARRRNIEPIAARSVLSARRDHLNDVARLQAIFKRHKTVVYLRTDAAVADIGVHQIGEVERRGARGKLLHVALRRKDIDLVLEHVQPNALKEF